MKKHVYTFFLLSTQEIFVNEPIVSYKQCELHFGILTIFDLSNFLNLSINSIPTLAEDVRTQYFDLYFLEKKFSI